MIIKAPIFILGAPKSGTSLFRALLDNHPELATIPFETTIFEILGEDIYHPYRKSKPISFQWDKEASFMKFEKLIKEYNTSSSPFIDSHHKSMFKGEVATYKEAFLKLGNKRDVFDFIIRFLIESYSGLEVGYFNNRRIVEKSIINVEFASVIKSYFPDAKFVHIVRNPYANIVALRRYKSERQFPSLPEIIITLESSYRHIFLNGRNIADYYIIKYEDLVESPEAQMKKVSKFLNIAYSADILTNPTLMGKPWSGNSTAKESFNGISKGPIDNWKHRISPIEAYYVNRIFDRILKAFEYEKFHMKGFYRINKHENIKTYLRNRLFKWFVNLV